jgi:2-polyprenyl-6-methoxyphenol hydroxylase-like FAD-dependent oxidoreductase
MRTALIVGAGIGGLSAAIALRQAGWHVRIYERAASPRELGFGLSLAPNVIAALRELQVADVVLARGFVPTRGEVRRMDGTVLKRAELPSPTALGGPMVMALRPALHGALLEAVGLDAIALGSEVAGFAEHGGRVTLQLAHGEIVEGDLLVGADGAGSVVRRALHPSEGPPHRQDDAHDEPRGLLPARDGVAPDSRADDRADPGDDQPPRRHRHPAVASVGVARHRAAAHRSGAGLQPPCPPVRLAPPRR